MAKTLRIFLVTKTFPQRFHTNPAGKVCSWRKSTATPFLCGLVLLDQVESSGFLCESYQSIT